LQYRPRNNPKEKLNSESGPELILTSYYCCSGTTYAPVIPRKNNVKEGKKERKSFAALMLPRHPRFPPTVFTEKLDVVGKRLAKGAKR
jgi:hypothetical protein